MLAQAVSEDAAKSILVLVLRPKFSCVLFLGFAQKEVIGGFLHGVALYRLLPYACGVQSVSNTDFETVMCVCSTRIAIFHVLSKLGPIFSILYKIQHRSFGNALKTPKT